MKNQKKRAILFSEGNFREVTSYLAKDAVWHVYEESQTIAGKEAIIAFGRQIANYFASVATQFETYGSLEEVNRVAVYGKATFIRDGRTVSVVHSCDLYEFNEAELITQIHSYCNSHQTAP